MERDESSDSPQHEKQCGERDELLRGRKYRGNRALKTRVRSEWRRPYSSHLRSVNELRKSKAGCFRAVDG